MKIEEVPELTRPIIKPNRDYLCQYCDKVWRVRVCLAPSMTRKREAVKEAATKQPPLRGPRDHKGVLCPWLNPGNENRPPFAAVFINAQRSEALLWNPSRHEHRQWVKGCNRYNAASFN